MAKEQLMIMQTAESATLPIPIPIGLIMMTKEQLMIMQMAESANLPIPILIGLEEKCTLKPSQQLLGL